MVNKPGYVELGLACADVSGALGRELGELSPSMVGAIEQLVAWVEQASDTIPGDLLTQLAITGFWRRSGGASPSGVNGARSGGSSTRKTIKRRSPPGGWTLTGSFVSSKCDSPLMYCRC